MPKGHWLWGNVFDIDKVIEQFHKWQKEYGDIYRLNMGGLKVIMVNQLKHLSFFRIEMNFHWIKGIPYIKWIWQITEAWNRVNLKILSVNRDFIVE